jgi:hypothetical protein
LDLDAFLLEQPTPDSAVALAEVLCRRELLTEFQATQLLKGKWRNFILGHYKVLRPIASGGMGRVLLARHAVMGRLVALKVMAPTTQPQVASVRRFFREGRALASLDHPNVVRAYDMGQEGPLFYLALEYVEGESLGQLIRRNGPVEVAEAADHVRQAALGLAHAHEAGWVHRDVKPDNLLLSPTGLVKVLDLGLARSLLDPGDDLTQAHQERQILGTIDYLSPEQVRPGGEVDCRSDVYSLGATFYALLIGAPPCGRGPAAQKLLWHLVEEAPNVRQSRPEVPEAMAALLHRMLAKEPAARPHLAEVADTLAAWCVPQSAAPLSSPSHAPLPLASAAPAATKPRRRRRWPLVAGLCMAGVAVAAGVLALILLSGDPAGRTAGLSPEEAASRVGSDVVVEMEVRSVGHDKAGRLIFLNSRPEFTDPKNFAIVIPRAVTDPKVEIDDVAKPYQNRRVRVRGQVDQYKGNAQIKVRTLDQIQILSGR